MKVHIFEQNHNLNHDYYKTSFEAPASQIYVFYIEPLLHSKIINKIKYCFICIEHWKH